MTRILLRSPKEPFEVISPEETLDRNVIGNNSGNLIFLEASHKILATAGTTVTADRFDASPARAAEINERYDVYVIPLANAFRLSFEPHLIKLTGLIERLKIPVVVLGVGAQSNVHYEFGKLSGIDQSVKEFIGAVLDRSSSLGVRGEFTADYVRGLGFRDVEVIGCPSMFLNGRALHVEKRQPALDRDARLTINVSPYVKSMAPLVRHHHERYADLTYVAQDLDTLERLLWGDTSGATAGSDIPIHTTHPFFRENKVRFFVDPWPWLDHVGGRDFVFGTRIHGNIAALVAGTPSYVLAHDSRTLELSRYFGIPHRRMADVSADLDAAELYEAADYGELNRGHAARFEVFTSYLERHGLRHVFADGEDGGAAFDARIAAVRFPPAVTYRGGSPVAGLRQGLRRTKRRARRWYTKTGWAKRARTRVARRLRRLTHR